ncbi:MAG TPA: transcriptional regulator [Firmicutes bacterium]|jgi:transcriptional regulator with XRE-family HTH domain|nr:transcriptional regulator [Bacillota bacterium]
MDLLRIGDKVLDRERVHKLVDRALELRSAGVSQQEVAKTLGTERSFVSRLESLGEIRKGGQIALIGFPVENKEELEKMAREEGIDFIFILTEEERWRFIENKNGLELFNEIMDLIARVKIYPKVIFLGSDMRIRLMEALLDRRVFGIELGPSPLREDIYVDAEELRGIIRSFS